MIDLDTATADDILARTLLGEARSEGIQGMSAVACVVVNRASTPCWWGHDIKGVCLAPYQFSAWNINDPNRTFMLNLDINSALYQSAHIIAAKAIDGDLQDITNGATHYRVIGTAASWDKNNQLTPVAIIGHHEFFKVD